MKTRNIEVVVINDIHLSSYGCHAIEILNYPKSISTRNLILNGDIIGGWQLLKIIFYWRVYR